MTTTMKQSNNKNRAMPQQRAMLLDPMQPARDKVRAGAAWIAEVARELSEAETPAQVADAVCDLLGIISLVYSAMIALECEAREEHGGLPMDRAAVQSVMHAMSEVSARDWVLSQANRKHLRSPMRGSLNALTILVESMLLENEVACGAVAKTGGDA